MREAKNAQVLLFSAAGVRFGVFIAEVGRLVTCENISPVPFAHGALAGLLDDPDEEAIPIFDLLGLLPGKKPPRHVPGARVALFETEQGPVGLRMDQMEGGGLHYTFLSDAAQRKSRMDALPEPLREPVTAVGEDERGPFFFFSADAFLAALDLGAPQRPD